MTQNFSHINVLLQEYLHLTEEECAAYITGVLDPPERDEIEDHLRLCRFCQQEIAAFQEALADLESGDLAEDSTGKYNE